MDPHPDFAVITPLRVADIGPFRLTPLDPPAVDEDFAVVTSSAKVLVGLFDAHWPKGLTLRGNAIDLAWHEREFTLARSFSWIIRDRDGVYLGCAYVFPDPGTRGSGKVYTWIRDRPDRHALIVAFNALFSDWIAPYLPPDAAYVWRSNNHGSVGKAPVADV